MFHTAGAGRKKLPNENEPVTFSFDDLEALAFPFLGKGLPSTDYTANRRYR